MPIFVRLKIINMQEKIKSEGKCLFCDKMFAKAGINRHLATHLKEKSETGQRGLSYLVKVETSKKWGSTPYFLSLWIDGEATFQSFDQFLRDIWLECCGHLSAFMDPEQKKKKSGMFDFMAAFERFSNENVVDSDQDMEEFEGDIPMRWKTKKVLCKGKVLDYEYDFGSTTALCITVIEQLSIKADSKIVLLSRNEPSSIMCTSCCKAPATQICTSCMYESPSVFCEKCAKKHAKKCSDFDDYSSMPVVNSPRMGVCGYEGGSIDKERD